MEIGGQSSRLKRIAILALGSMALSCSRPARGPQESGSLRSDQEIPSRDQLLLASAKVALPPAGLTPADLPNPGSSGAMIWGRYCALCHALPTPLAHSATDWPRVLRRMWLRMGLIDSTYGITAPTTVERFTMLAYADSNALQVVSSRLPDLPGRDLFIDRCSRCHELADPYQHSPEDWVPVVRRMMEHMESITGATMTATELAQVTGFLQSVSGGA